ncbi:MAG: transglutaminase family protein [Candidatus Phosphoribacter sp.]
MSATLRIVHSTGFSYAGGATASFNEARMMPRSSHEQQVVHSRIDVSPVPWTSTYTDYWGTSVTAFEVFERHEALSVTATSVVDIQRQPVTDARLSWAELADASVIDAHCELLELSDRVAPPEDLLAAAHALRAQSATPREFALGIVDLVHTQVRYEFGSTGVHTQASEAWQQRVGVCQDMAHLVIGALRVEGVPARYVSGYLMPSKASEVDVPYAGESHAWVQFWDGAWVGADPTNNVLPGDLHVEVAVGRDYRDVAPLTGIFTGGGASNMFVSVEVTRLA